MGQRGVVDGTCTLYVRGLHVVQITFLQTYGQAEPIFDSSPSELCLLIRVLSPLACLKTANIWPISEKISTQIPHPWPFYIFYYQRTCELQPWRSVRCSPSVRLSVRPSVRVCVRPSVCPWTLACARRFLRNCKAEFIKTWHTTSTLVVVDARCFSFQIISNAAVWWQIENFC